MLNNNEKGRSMLEMLSVLAIIGVLSAGGLAGYNKAMLWHKLNKHTDEITYLLATVIYNSEKLKDASYNLVTELQGLNAFLWNIDAKPIDDTAAHAKNIRFNDSFNNQTWFEHSVGGTQFAFATMVPSSNFSIKICYNYINIFKGVADELDVVYVTRKTEGKKFTNAYMGKGCTQGKCLINMTNNDIINLCKNHCEGADEYCTLYAIWGYPASSVAVFKNL